MLTLSIRKPWQRPLLATEATSFDAGAQNLALDWAARQGLPLAVAVPLHTTAELEMQAPQLVEQREADLAQRLIPLREQAQQRGVALAVEVCRGEDLARAIGDAARRTGADLIFIRRRGERGFFARLLMGEMVSQVIASAPCDVLVAARAARHWSRGVLLAWDPSRPSPVALSRAVQLAQQAAVPVWIAAGAEPGDAAHHRAVDEALAQAVAQARGLGVEAHAELCVTRLAQLPQALTQAAARRGCDVTVMDIHGVRPALPQRVGSLTEQVIGQSRAEAPVLLVRS